MAAANTVILLDVSSSMAEPLGRQRRVDALQGVLDQLLPSAPGAAVIAFSSLPVALDRGARLPEPSGSTALHLGLEAAAKLHPSLVIVISDGRPDDAYAALAAARGLHCRIAGTFVGDERDHGAVAFLRALAWQSKDGLGQAVIADLRKPAALAAGLQLLLASPGA